jgi:hypothetical protein
MNVKFRKLGWLEWRWLGVFIASNHFLDVGCRWHTGQSYGAPDMVLFTVRCLTRQQTIRVWSGCPLKSFVLLLHREVRYHNRHVRCVLTSQLWLVTSALCTFYYSSQSIVGASDRCSIGSPDNPVNYSGAPPWETREWPVREVLGLGTEHCPVRHWQYQC